MKKIILVFCAVLFISSIAIATEELEVVEKPITRYVRLIWDKNRQAFKAMSIVKKDDEGLPIKPYIYAGTNEIEVDVPGVDTKFFLPLRNWKYIEGKHEIEARTSQELHQMKTEREASAEQGRIAREQKEQRIIELTNELDPKTKELLELKGIIK